MNLDEYDIPVVIYDGECRFCHWNVDLILKYEKNREIKFAWLQNQGIQTWLKNRGIPLDFNTFLVYDQGMVYSKGKAAIHLAKELRFPFNAIGLIRYLPNSWVNACYDIIAKHRKKIMGSTTCALPIGQEDRFLY